jgi:hypothetical protein
MDELELLIARMHQSPRDQALMYCRRALGIALADGISPFAWEVLLEIVDDDALWGGGELPQLLEHYQLPSDRETLRQASWANAGTQPHLRLNADLA